MDATQGEFDVAIIGAGVSGLSAAYQLWKKDRSLRLVVLEAKDRIGGRTCCGDINTAQGPDICDLGGEWISEKQYHIVDLVNELGLEKYADLTKGKKVLQLSDNKVSSSEGDGPAIPWYASLDLRRFITKMNNLIESIDPEDPGAFHDAENLDNRTFEDVKNSLLWTRAAKEIVEISNRCMFAAEDSQLSALYCLKVCASCGGLKTLIGAGKNIGGQEMKIKGGAWQVCQRLEEKIGKEKIVLKQVVVQIIQDDNGVSIKTIDGPTYRCQRVILALPPSEQARIDYVPSLPVEKLDVLHRMPMGNLTKVIITYETKFWEAAGFSGEAVTRGGSSVIKGLDHGPLCLVFAGWTTKGSPVLVGFIGGRQQIQYSSLRAEERKKAVLHNLSELFGKKALDPIDYKEKNWSLEPYSHGAVCSATPGITIFSPGLRRPFGRLHFAGTETATLWSGFINGAVQSGYRAAKEVLYHLRPQLVTSSDFENMGHVRKVHRTEYNRRGTSLFYWSALLTVAVGIVYLAKYRHSGLLNLLKFD